MITTTAARSVDDTARAVTLLDEFTALPADHPGRARSRAAAIEAWTPMARRLARKFNGRGENLDDLVQVASLGLIKAIDRYDAGRGIDFPGFAIPTILGELKRHFRDHTWAVRVPRRTQEMRLAINKASSDLSPALGRAPTVAEIATRLGVGEEEVLEGLEGAQAYSSTSLSEPATAGGTIELVDTLGGEDAGFDLAELRADLGPALAALTERERTIIMLRFYGNQSQTQIAEQIGISQMHVSRLITRSLVRLRKAMSA